MLERVACLSFRRRRAVLLAWLVAAIAVVAATSAFGGEFSGGGRLKGTDSDAAYALLNREFPSTHAEGVTVVFADTVGVATDRAGIERYLTAVRAIPPACHRPSCSASSPPW